MERTKARGGIRGTKLLNVAVPVVSVLLAFVLGCLIMVILGKNPFEALQYLWVGAFGSLANLGITLNKATPLLQ